MGMLCGGSSPKNRTLLHPSEIRGGSPYSAHCNHQHKPMSSYEDTNDINMILFTLW